MTRLEHKQLYLYLKSLPSNLDRLKYIVDQFGHQGKFHRILENTKEPISAELRKWINDQTPLLQDPYYKWSTKVYWILHGIKDFPKCKHYDKCGTVFKYNVKLFDGYFECCKKCNNAIYSSRTKHSKQTQKDRYGVECYMSLPEFKTRRVETWKKNLGVDNSFKSPIVREHHRQNCLEEHGVEYTTQRRDVIDKQLKTQRRNYYTSHLMHDSSYKPLFTIEQFANAKRTDQLWWQCLNEDCRHVFAAPYARYCQCAGHLDKFCPFCRSPYQRNASRTEYQIAKFIRENFKGLEVIHHQKVNRHIIPPNEIDIWIPEKKIAIEYNGVFWHSVEFDTRYRRTTKNKIFDKTVKCESLGIRLVHIYEDEWRGNCQKTKDLICDIISGQDIRNLTETSNDCIKLPRDKYPAFMKIPGYGLQKVEEPVLQVHHGIGKKNQVVEETVFHIYDSGALVFKKLQ